MKLQTANCKPQTFSWQIRASECDPEGFARLPTVLNLLQESASLHAEQLGFSKSSFAALGQNISWVLSRLRIRMERYPSWEERISISTWPRTGRRITALRDFQLFGEDSAPIGIATSEWMVIDLASRRIVPIPDSVLANANDELAPVFGSDAFSRLRWDCQIHAANALRFRAKRADIDLNGHVNNIHYAEWFLETLPQGRERCTDCEILFKSETFAGDEVIAEAVELEPGVFFHRVSSPDGHDHVLAKTSLSPSLVLHPSPNHQTIKPRLVS